MLVRLVDLCSPPWAMHRLLDICLFAHRNRFWTEKSLWTEGTKWQSPYQHHEAAEWCARRFPSTRMRMTQGGECLRVLGICRHWHIHNSVETSITLYTNRPKKQQAVSLHWCDVSCASWWSFDCMNVHTTHDKINKECTTQQPSKSTSNMAENTNGMRRMPNSWYRNQRSYVWRWRRKSSPEGIVFGNRNSTATKTKVRKPTSATVMVRKRNFKIAILWAYARFSDFNAKQKSWCKLMLVDCGMILFCSSMVYCHFCWCGSDNILAYWWSFQISRQHNEHTSFLSMNYPSQISMPCFSIASFFYVAGVLYYILYCTFTCCLDQQLLRFQLEDLIQACISFTLDTLC